MEPLEKWLKLFGLTAFRQGQREVITAILDNRDTLCIMPTGGGKSLCYQLPALARRGVTLVVSPLIALMKDQVDGLNSRGIPATFINSSLSISDQQSRISGLSNGDFKLVYIAPERLRNAAFLKALARVDVKLLAIDEAHCISQWGHDFRPDYARLGRFRERLGNPQTIALTATATQNVRADIQNVLNLVDPAVFVTGFARNNLAMHVEMPKSNSEKDRRVVEFLRTQPGSGIIYAATRKTCEHLVELLQQEFRQAPEFYHAGMPHLERHRVQENFMSGKTPIVVATNAFGMGIDKPDVRFVIHYNLPGSLEAYYQEAGRAGRDGKASLCLLLYSFQDRFVQEFFIENSFPSREMIQQVYEYFQSFDRDPIEITLQELKDQLGLSIGTEGLATCEHLLEKAGALERLDSSQNMAAVRIESNLPTLVEMLPRESRQLRSVLRGLERVVGPLRGERVTFSPKSLSDHLNMKWESVVRSIRQLVELKLVDYVPPFRGRAIHLVDRNRRFREIPIDFGELEQRKKSEYARLERMISFATSYRCRQLEILEYFGDSDRQPCQLCDRCGAKMPQLGGDMLAPLPAQQKDDDTSGISDGSLLYVVQVALSGVWRTRRRVGKGLISKMLKGSSSKQMLSSGLQKLSTFGLLQSLKQTEIESLLDCLLGAGLLVQKEQSRFRPVLVVSDLGKDFLNGQVSVPIEKLLGPELAGRIKRLFRGKEPKKLRTDSEIVVPRIDAALCQAPNRERPEYSPKVEPEEIGPLSVPRPHVDWAEISRGQKPAASSNEYEFVPGSGDDSSPEITFAEGRGGLYAPSAAPNSSRVETGGQPDQLDSEMTRGPHYWSCRLFADGYLIGEIAEIRNLPISVIQQHLHQAIIQDSSSRPAKD